MVCAIDERHDPFGARVEPAEDDAHHQVADEPAEALVEVVAAADQRAGEDDPPLPPADRAPPAEEVADHDDLLEHGVLGRREHEHGDRPPRAGQVGGGDRGVEVEGLGGGVERQAGQPDRGGEQRAAAEVQPRAPQVEAHGVRLVRVVAAQQVQREQHGHQRDDDAGQLVREVEPGPVGGDRAVHRRGLRPERLGAGQLVDDAKERPDRRGAEGDTEDEPGLGEVPAPHAASGYAASPDVGRTPAGGLLGVSRTVRPSGRRTVRRSVGRGRPGRSQGGRREGGWSVRAGAGVSRVPTATMPTSEGDHADADEDLQERQGEGGNRGVGHGPTFLLM